MVESKQNEETLRKVFDSFDKDKNGFIDISEIKALSKELGHEITDAEVQNIFSEIDANKDGNISFEEFSIWWHSGKANKLEGLVYYQLKAQKLLSKAHASVQRLGKSLDTKYDTTVESHYIGIQAGDSEHKTKIDIRAAMGGEEEKLLFDHTLGKLDRPWHQDSIVLSFKSPNPESAKDGLKNLIDTARQFVVLLRPEAEQLFAILDFEYFSTADVVGVAITTISSAMKTFARNLSSTFRSVIGEKTGSMFHAHIGLQNDIASMFKNTQDNVRKTIVEELIESFFVEVHAKITPLILAFTRQHFFTTKVGEGKLGPEVIPLLLQGSKLSFKLSELKVESLTKFIPFLSQIPALGDLFELAKGAGVIQMIQGIPLAQQALEFFREHAKANMTLTIRYEEALASLHLHTSGIKEVFDYLFQQE